MNETDVSMSTMTEAEHEGERRENTWLKSRT